MLIWWNVDSSELNATMRRQPRAMIGVMMIGDFQQILDSSSSAGLLESAGDKVCVHKTW